MSKPWAGVDDDKVTAISNMLRLALKANSLIVCAGGENGIYFGTAGPVIDILGLVSYAKLKVELATETELIDLLDAEERGKDLDTVSLDELDTLTVKKKAKKKSK